jgi:membrane protein required for beta-lactamase induction
MAKLTAWLVTILGVLLVLQLIPGLDTTFSGVWFNWVVALIVLVIGIGKLMRNYSRKK